MRSKRQWLSNWSNKNSVDDGNVETLGVENAEIGRRTKFNLI
jgi:hypothetical protein